MRTRTVTFTPYISHLNAAFSPHTHLRCLTLLIVALAEGMTQVLVSELPQYSLYLSVQCLELYFLSLKNGRLGCMFQADI